MVPVSAEGPAWDMEIDNRRPFLGDLVLIRISSLYANEDAHIEVKFNGTTVRNIWVRTTFAKRVNVEWQTSLDAEPGEYKLCLIYLGVHEVNRTIILVYDPLDFAMKSIARLEREVYRLDQADDRTEGWSLLALRRVEYYLYRWVAAGMVINILSIITLMYLGPTAYRKYVFNAARRGIRGAKDWGPTVDGHLVGQMGKEAMMTTKPRIIPEPGLSFWCPTCKVLVHSAEAEQHDHKKVVEVKAPDGFEWEEVPKKVFVRKVVRPLRVLKRRVVVPKLHVDPHTPEVD